MAGVIKNAHNKVISCDEGARVDLCRVEGCIIQFLLSVGVCFRVFERDSGAAARSFETWYGGFTRRG